MESYFDKDMNEVLLAEKYYKLKENKDIININGTIFLLRLIYYLFFCFGMLILLFVDFDIIFYFSETDQNIKNGYEDAISIQIILSLIFFFISLISYVFSKIKERELDKNLEINFDDIA